MLSGLPHHQNTPHVPTCPQFTIYRSPCSGGTRKCVIILLFVYLSSSLSLCSCSLSGCIAFIGVAAYFLSRPSIEVQWQEKAVFSAFFAGAILCMGFSFLFHTMFCHSERVGKLFNK